MSATPEVQGLHERLADIFYEITGVSFEEIADSSCHMTPKMREKFRAAARRVLALCDEHEKLDAPPKPGNTRGVHK